MLSENSYIVSAMVSTEIKSNELSTNHLAKTFYFVLIGHFKAKSKDLPIWLNTLNFELNENPY